MSLFQGAIQEESIFRSYDGGLFTLNIEDYISKHAEGRLMQHLDDLTEQCRVNLNQAKARNELD